jgi:hypothetical protein
MVDISERPRRTREDESQYPSSGRRLHIRTVLVIILVCMALGALLNADILAKEASTKPLGTERDIWMNVWRPVQWVSHVTGLNQPRKWLDSALGNNDKNQDFVLPPPSDGSGPVGAGAATPGHTTTPKPGETPTPTPTPAPRLFTPTANHKLRIWAGGDSMSMAIDESLARLGGNTGVMNVATDSRVSTGLTRPDYFNWPGEINSIVKDDNPDVMVFITGANDWQGMTNPDGSTFDSDAGSDRWIAEYARRVAGVMSLMEAPHRLVIWIGLPVMASARYDQDMQKLSAIYEQEAKKHPGVVYVPLYSLFQDSNGNWARYLPTGANGDLEEMRIGNDGVHFSIDGGDRAANAVLDVIKKQAGLG